MGFLKFLKREKKEEDELDLPPAPPPLEGFEELDLPEMPDIEKISAPEDFKLDIPEEKDFGKENMQEPDFPEMPSMPEMPEEHEEEMLKFGSPSLMQVSIQPSPIQPQQESIEPEHLAEPEEPQPQTEERYAFHPRHERKLFMRERAEPRIFPRGKSVYVRVDKFKAALGSINVVRRDLRKADEALIKMENVKISKDRSFEKLRLSLDDLQKRLIFIDKTLFRGD